MKALKCGWHTPDAGELALLSTSKHCCPVLLVFFLFNKYLWPLIDFDKCESFLESNSPEPLALFETNLNDSIDSGIFSVTGYLPLIWKNSITYMHGLAVYVKEVLPFTWDLYLYKTMDSQCHFLLLITFFAFAYNFLFYFHLTFSISSMHRWGSLNQPIYQCVCFWWI